MPEIERYILKGRRLSGRAVQLRTLLPSQTDQVARDAAKESKDPVMFRQTQLRLGVCRCLVAITREPVPTIRVPVMKDGAPATGDDGQPLMSEELDMAWLADERNWMKPSPVEIEMNYDKFVTNPKDDHWLCTWWADAHEAPVGLINDIMEKGQRVSSG